MEVREEEQAERRLIVARGVLVFMFTWCFRRAFARLRSAAASPFTGAWHSTNAFDLDRNEKRQLIPNKELSSAIETQALINSKTSPSSATSTSSSSLSPSSSSASLDPSTSSPPLPNPPEDRSWRERAKAFASEYGKVGLCTHAVLSIISLSVIYAGISYGLDVDAILHSVGLSTASKKDSTAAASSAGTFVLSYTIYKLASPLRWPLTFAVTPLVVRVLRRRGYLAPKLPTTRTTSSSSSPTKSSSIDR